MNPEAYCRSHPQDQAAWSILVAEHDLPLVDFTREFDNKVFWHVVAELSRGAFSWRDRRDETVPFVHGAQGYSPQYAARGLCADDGGRASERHVRGQTAALLRA